MSRQLRPIAPPFVVDAPAGARVRAKISASPPDVAVLAGLGGHLGSLAGADVALRCSQGRLDAKATVASRKVRKQALTASCSSRWAGAITRTSEDAWGLAERNLAAEVRSLKARIGRLRRRVGVPVGERSGRIGGYGSQAQRWEKQRRLQALQGRLVGVEARLSRGRMSVCRGGRRLAGARHHLEAAGLDETGWRRRWQAERWFITADGEADKAWGNETIRWQPEQRWLEVKLPAPLVHLANRPHGTHTASQGQRPLAELRQHSVLAVDLNAAHLAAVVLDPSGNPVGGPATLPLDLAGLAATTRDGRLRGAISELITLAKPAGCSAIVIEDLDFAQARSEGREHAGRRPARGRRGRAFRRLIAGIPTARFRDRLVQMAANAGLAVVAVDPAYTSRWGAEHWLGALRDISPDASGHHAAALVIGRRGLAQRARRRERCDSTPPEDGRQRATDSAVRPMPATPGLCESRPRKPGTRKARGQPHPWQKTRPADRSPPGNQAAQDRSGLPAGQDSLLLSV